MNETDGQGLWFLSAPGATAILCKPTECRLSTILGTEPMVADLTVVRGLHAAPL